MKILRNVIYVSYASLFSTGAFAMDPTAAQEINESISKKMLNMQCGAISPPDTLSAKNPNHYNGNPANLNQRYPTDVNYSCTPNIRNPQSLPGYDAAYAVGGNGLFDLCKGTFTYELTPPKGSTCQASSISPIFYTTVDFFYNTLLGYLFQSNLLLTNITIDKTNGLLKAVYGGGTSDMDNNGEIVPTEQVWQNYAGAVTITVLYPLPKLYMVNAGCTGAADLNSGKKQVSTTIIRDSKGNKTGASCSVEANVGTTP